MHRFLKIFTVLTVIKRRILDKLFSFHYTDKIRKERMLWDALIVAGRTPMEIIIAVAAAPPCLSMAFTNSPILPILLVLPQFLPCQFLRFPPAIAGWPLFSAFSSVFWESIVFMWEKSARDSSIFLPAAFAASAGWSILSWPHAAALPTKPVCLWNYNSFSRPAVWSIYSSSLFLALFLWKPSKARIYALCL